MIKNKENIALMYLSEQTTPDDCKIKNITPIKHGIAVSFDACLHSFGVMNRNMRMYVGKNVMNQINSTERIQDGLRYKRWMGEMDHPGQVYQNMPLTAERVQKIDMNNASHIIMDPRLEKGDSLLMARIETYAGTNAGIGMARAIDVNHQTVAFSCRSIASMNNKGGKPLVEIKKLITYDWVIYPSHREANELPNSVVVIESVGGKKPSNISNDICIPFTEFVDFRNYISEKDENVSFLVESAGYDIDHMVGIDPTSKNLIFEQYNGKVFVNTSVETKKKVDNFLHSFDF